MPLGPRDRRLQRSRCINCIKRHLKCSESSPCTNCARHNWPCSYSKSQKLITLETVKSSNEVHDHIQLKWTSSPILDTCLTKTEDKLITSFFEYFIPFNNFSGRDKPYIQDVTSLIQTFPALPNAILALTAIYMKDHASSKQLAQSRLAFGYEAYISASRQLQKEITSAIPYNSLHSLWTVYILGIFELMVDPSGQNWVKHLLYGISEMLTRLEPKTFLSGLERRFFLEFRMFEIIRSMLFTQPTYLTTKRWKLIMDNIWNGNNAMEWHPKEALLDIMVCSSELAVKVTQFVASRDAACLLPSDKASLQHLAQEGYRIRNTLAIWRDNLSTWIERQEMSETMGYGHSDKFQKNETIKENQTLLSLILYSAASIHLSGIYDYHIHWMNCSLPTPSLSENQIQEHVTSIFSLTAQALKVTNLAGPVFFLPLRIAGARATTNDQKNEVKRLYSIISKPFQVANTFVSDLEGFWAEMDSLKILEY